MDDITTKLSGLKVSSEKTAIFTFSRMNPPHKGHGKLITIMISIMNSLKKQNKKSTIFICLSQTENEENPLSFDNKKQIIKNWLRYIPTDHTLLDKNKIKILGFRTPQEAVTSLKDKGYNSLYCVIGEDRQDGFGDPAHEAYNPNFYNYVKNEGFNWLDIDKESLFDSNKRFYKTNKYKQRNHELLLSEKIQNDYLESSYQDLIVPKLSHDQIINIIVPRIDKGYTLVSIDDDEEKKQKSIEIGRKETSATLIRKLASSVKIFTAAHKKFTGKDFKIEETRKKALNERWNFFRQNHAIRQLERMLLQHSYPTHDRRWTYFPAGVLKTIWLIKNGMGQHTDKTYAEPPRSNAPSNRRDSNEKIHSGTAKLGEWKSGYDPNLRTPGNIQDPDGKYVTNDSLGGGKKRTRKRKRKRTRRKKKRKRKRTKKKRKKRHRRKRTRRR